ncbi:P-II family nitrogen regulator [Bradyrhizobium liaoningense]
MSSESGMTIVTALIRPHMEEHVVRALHDLPEFPGFFFVEVRGQGRGRGAGGSYTASESDLTYHHFLQLQIACRPDQVSEIRNAIAAAAWTGRKGDGVIFTADATSFVRIREKGRPDTGAAT